MVVRRVLVKTGYIFINNKKIKLASTLARTAANINKKSNATGVKAKIVRDNKGNERLVLTSSKRTVSIKDPNKLLANLVKNSKIGKGSDKLVQIVGKGSIGNNVRVKYSQKAPEAKAADTLKLAETSKKLAQRLFPEVANENNDDDALRNAYANAAKNAAAEAAKKIAKAAIKSQFSAVAKEAAAAAAKAKADQAAEQNDLQNAVENVVGRAVNAYESYAERQAQEKRALTHNIDQASNSVTTILSNKYLKNVPEDEVNYTINQKLSSMGGFDSQNLKTNRRELIQGISKALVAANESKRGFFTWGKDDTYRLTNADINAVVDRVTHKVFNVNALTRMYNAF